jgi:hypothetical protein
VRVSPFEGSAEISKLEKRRSILPSSRRLFVGGNL